MICGCPSKAHSTLSMEWANSSWIQEANLNFVRLSSDQIQSKNSQPVKKLALEPLPAQVAQWVCLFPPKKYIFLRKSTEPWRVVSSTSQPAFGGSSCSVLTTRSPSHEENPQWHHPRTLSLLCYLTPKETQCRTMSVLLTAMPPAPETESVLL